MNAEKWEEVKKIVARHFDWTFNWDFINIVLDIIDGIEDFDSDDDVWYSIDRALIYTKDQWTILMFYCTPQEANFDEAIEYLTNDIYTIVSKIKEVL